MSRGYRIEILTELVSRVRQPSRQRLIVQQALLTSFKQLECYIYCLGALSLGVSASVRRRSSQEASEPPVILDGQATGARPEAKSGLDGHYNDSVTSLHAPLRTPSTICWTLPKLQRAIWPALFLSTERIQTITDVGTLQSTQVSY